MKDQESFVYALSVPMCFLSCVVFVMLCCFFLAGKL
jgi:hypothetical protein